MKTIKELEANERRYGDNWWLGYQKALKDVNKLIDEWVEDYLNNALTWREHIEELKSRIEG